MSIQDPISNMFSSIMNAQAVAKQEITIPVSKLKLSIAKLLKDEGYILDYCSISLLDKNILKIKLKYYQSKPVISILKRVSRPGLRVYKSYNHLPKIMNGLGIAIVSTSKGLMSDRMARSLGEGGEIIGIVT